MADLTTHERFPRAAYLLDGRAVRVHSRINGEYLVELGYEDDDGEMYYEGFDTAAKVFDQPPTEAHAKVIRELEAQAKQLRNSVTALRAQERDAKNRVEALKKYAALERIEDFLAGKITHYVIWQGYVSDLPIPRVAALEDERCGNDKRPSDPLKLLTLYGNKDRTVEWKLNHYSDGSGNHVNCIPCCSREEAIEKARAMLAESFARYQRPSYGNTWAAEKLIEAAKALEAPIPDGFEVWLHEHQIRGLQEEVLKCEQSRETWLARIRALEAPQCSTAQREVAK